MFDLTELRIQIRDILDPALSIHMDKEGRIGLEYRVNAVMKAFEKYLNKKMRGGEDV